MSGTATSTTARTLTPIVVGDVVRDTNGVVGQVIQTDALFCGEPAIRVKTQNGQFLSYHRNAIEVIGVMARRWKDK